VSHYNTQYYSKIIKSHYNLQQKTHKHNNNKMTELSENVSQAYQLLNSVLLVSKDWKYHCTKDGVKISFLKPPKNSSSQTNYVKGEISIANCTIDEYMAVHDSQEFSVRKTWDTKLVELDIYQPTTTKYSRRVGRLGYAFGVLGVSNRDFIFDRFVFEESPDRLVSVSSHADKPEVRGYVRGRIWIASYIMEQVQNDLKITYISQFDMNGWVPQVIVNAAVMELPLGMARVAANIGKTVVTN
jgi:hypothetical protein